MGRRCRRCNGGGRRSGIVGNLLGWILFLIVWMRVDVVLGYQREYQC